MKPYALFDTLTDPKRAAVIGAAGGAIKGVLVGAIAGKWLLWMSLGALGGAIAGYGLSRWRSAAASTTPAEWGAA